ncbi:glutamate receptor ionotropic, kainate 2-like [Bombus affinis]|uniref:glutamate receptor ionotropic, kainate 2-like n=1 Tax=Bombus affinis TaxID=309941 RepID=UPI0021B77F2F|nr:glutamate receptor ionotropic, kainate 2-like [Bombus affinis]XP_050585067.1 glutamate receptor ionotropic, kainate 2-like [Bombus affinis]XP_050585068.1 glutamate receptor ionotropic, kainate 2-like [Bombus affinis]
MLDNYKCLSLIIFSCVLGSCKGASVNVGGLFDTNDGLQRAFETSIKRVNEQRHMSDAFPNVFFVAKSNEIDTDPFNVSQIVCELMTEGVAAIFGPNNRFTSGHVQSMCDTMEVPHIYGRWEPSQIRGIGVNLFPYAETLSMVFNKIITDFEWKIFAILYADTDSLFRTHRLLEHLDIKAHTIFLYNLGTGPSYRKVMREIKDEEIENILIDCSIHILEEVLKQAQQVGIMSEKNRIIVTSLDLQTIDLEPYQYSGVNFTGVRLIDPESPLVTSVVEMHKYEWGLDDPSKLRVEPALMYDAVQLFARAFKRLRDTIKANVKTLPCDGTVSWEHGFSLNNFMRVSEMEGLTGLIKFDTAGFRSNFQLDIVRVTENGLKKIGIWNSTNDVEWLLEARPQKSEEELSLQNKTFLILIAINHPYGMLKQSADMMTGNDRYEGFGIDIIQELSKMLGFNYTFEVQRDNVYGSYSKKLNKWTGMLGKIIAGEADLAITDLTITAEREGAVDFTMPFMNLGISILYRKPTKTPPSLFSFLSPFSTGVWWYLIGAYIFVSVVLFIIGRICPAEWNNPYPCIEEPEVLENQFTFKNSLWFTIGSLMQQGSEIAPIGFSTRMMATSWWFFCLIIANCYTANLAAFLTVETIVSPFSNVEELARKKTIKYGAKIGGSTFMFFQDSNYSTYKEMYKYMTDNAAEVLPSNNDAGLTKVLREDYAFLMESSSIEYITERYCNVTQIGGLLDAKGYGIAMRKGSPYRHPLNTAVLKMQQSGLITELKKKWWTQKRGGGTCREDGGQSAAEELDLDNVGGVFLVLTVGVAASFFYTVFELIWEVGCTSLREDVSFKEELMAELKFIIKCDNSPKPVRRRKGSSNRSGEDSTRGCTPPYGFIPVIKTSNSDDK